MRLSLLLFCVALMSASACVGESPSKAPTDGSLDESCAGSSLGEPALRRLSAWELDNTLRDVFGLGDEWLGVRLGADPVSEAGFTNDAEMLFVAGRTAEDLLATAEDVAELVVTGTSLSEAVSSCATVTSDCADAAIGHYGRRLFRRPLSDDERSAYRQLFDQVANDSDDATGLKWALVALIQSPYAVYRRELGSPDGDQYTLSQYELASALSYTYAGTAPSDALLEKAEQGELSSPEALAAEARALLETGAGREALHRLLAEWLGYTRIRGKARDAVVDFPVIADQMIEETEHFLEQVLVAEQGGMAELIRAPYTFVNDELAAFYGFDASGDFGRVDRPADRGIGLLAQGSMLASYAHMDGSSPTLRGLWVFERLLCGEAPLPPDEVPPLPPFEPGDTTTRDRYENQHGAEGCKSCHVLFDPTGFAFEHFDEAGRYRADEDGLAIDDSGAVVFPEAGEMIVDGLDDLAETLAASTEPSACAAELWAIYAYGGVSGATCSIAAPRGSLIAGDIGLVEYLAQLAATPHFSRRKLSQ